MATRMQQQSFSESELPANLALLKEKALWWAQQFGQVAVFEGNGIPYAHGGFRNLLGVSSAENGKDYFQAGLQQ